MRDYGVVTELKWVHPRKEKLDQLCTGVRADIHDLVSDREHLLTVFKKLNSWRCKVHKEKAKKADEDREVLRRMTEVVRGCPDSEKKLAELQSKYGAGLRNQWPGSIEDFKSTFIDDDYYEWVKPSSI